MHIAQKWQTAKLFMLTLHQNLQRFCIFALQIICSQPMYNIAIEAPQRVAPIGRVDRERNDSVCSF